MIPIEKLNSVKKVYTHGDCADGVASSMILHDILPKAQIKFLKYGTKEHETIEPELGLLFCDITPKNHIQEFVDAGTIVLDHHKTTKVIVAAFGENGVFGDEVNDPGVCGAVLAFREVWAPLCKDAYNTNAITLIRMRARNAYDKLVYDPVPHLENSIEDLPEYQNIRDFAYTTGVYDTWQTQSPLWQKAITNKEALKFFSPESWLSKRYPFHPANQGWLSNRLDLGVLLQEKHMSRVHAALKGAYRYTTGYGTKVVIFETMYLTSDAAEVVDKEADLIVGFDYKFEDNQAVLMLSTRSHTNFDCAAFCKCYGGGGHTKAAGCSMSFYVNLYPGGMDPYSTIKNLVAQYETYQG